MKRHEVVVARAYQACSDIARNSGSNFYRGMSFTLNRHKRLALFSVYAWMRAIDDIADGDLSRDEKMTKIHVFYDKTAALYSGSLDLESASLWMALNHTIHHYTLPLSYFHDMFLGQLQSIEQNSYANFEELYQYCYRVASVVGLICISIWGYEGGAAALKLAEYRGIALQLTNIIRDVYQDTQEGKSYIPAEWMGSEPRGAWDEMVEQAEHYYEASRDLERMVSRSGRLSLQLMTGSYELLLHKMKKKPQEVLQGQMVGLSKSEKLGLCFKEMLKWCLAR